MAPSKQELGVKSSQLVALVMARVITYYADALLFVPECQAATRRSLPVVLHLVPRHDTQTPTLSHSYLNTLATAP